MCVIVVFVCVFVVFFFFFFENLNEFFSALIVNEVDDSGVFYIAEALKMNNILIDIDFFCE